MAEPDAAAPAGDQGGTTTPASGEDEPGALPLTGMTVVVTGAMSGQLAALSRNQMNELIERAGGRASSSVSAKTSLVVAGDNAGSKRAKAESLGVRIASPKESAEMVAHLL
ncbi:BRCT domain-containing protein [Microbispora sp. H10949]|uniref:BRCT domain-containing protein n=1 Tax=Microbispora sp. H10949 TaxID=2729111 RepID=UPI001602FCA6|nr:BRCT domain-containing protein [Microbispora sp. H10949]